MEVRRPIKTIQGKLEAMEEIPEGVTFDANGIWQKLETSLQPAGKKRIRVWYYVAAGLVVLMVIWIFGYRNNSTNVPAPSNKTIGSLPNKNATEWELSNQPMIKARPQSASHNDLGIAAKKSIRNLSQDGNQERPATIDRINLPVKMISPDQLPLGTIAVSRPEQLPVSALPVSSPIAVVKPILKVMHINEMGNSVSAPIQITEPAINLLLLTRTTDAPENGMGSFENTNPDKSKSIFKTFPAFQNH
jgi:hypothetical protein